jgi:hypothetical protein
MSCFQKNQITKDFFDPWFLSLFTQFLKIPQIIRLWNCVFMTDEAFMYVFAFTFIITKKSVILSSLDPKVDLNDWKNVDFDNLLNRSLELFTKRGVCEN